MTAQPLTSFKITNKQVDSVVYLVELEEDDRFIVQGSHFLEDAISAHLDGELSGFMRNTDGSWDGHLYDPEIGQDYRITATPLESYGVKS